MGIREALEALRAYSEKIKDQPGYYLDHSRWHAEHPPGHPDPTVWFHGTKREFNEFGHAVDVADSSRHWNNYLGTHLAHHPEVAERFARDWTGGERGRIISSRLRIQNPRYFPGEDTMAGEVAGWMADQERIPDQSLQDAYITDKPLHVGNYLRERPATATHVLNELRARYPDLASENAQAYVAYLRSLGHDGITYVNDIEGGIGAIAFHPDQIEEAYGHGDKTRRFADTSHLHDLHNDLVLAPSRTDPHVKRWQAWHREAGDIPRDMQPHAARLHLKLKTQLDRWGHTFEDAQAHARKALPASDQATALGVQRHHVAEAMQRVQTFAPALVDHLYSGEHAHTPQGKAALERLSHVHFDLGMEGDLSDAQYTFSPTGNAQQAKVKIHPWALGAVAAPGDPMGDGGTLTPEAMFAHEVAHALDEQLGHARRGTPVTGKKLGIMEQAKLGMGGSLPEMTNLDVSPPKFRDLHDHLHGHARHQDAEERRLYQGRDLQLMPPLPLHLARLHYPLGGTVRRTDPIHGQADQMGRLGAEWVTTLTELAMEQPHALRALDQHMNNGSRPLADRVRDHWGFDFPHADQARVDSDASRQSHIELEDDLRQPVPSGRGVAAHDSSKMLRVYHKSVVK